MHMTLSKLFHPSFNIKRVQFHKNGWNYASSNDFIITKTHLFKYTENFTTEKWKFSDKNIDSFFEFLFKIQIVGTR